MSNWEMTPTHRRYSQLKQSVYIMSRLAIVTRPYEVARQTQNQTDPNSSPDKTLEPAANACPCVCVHSKESSEGAKAAEIGKDFH